MGGDGLGCVSSGPMRRLVASLKVSRWFGEGLRQWRRPLRASSVTPHRWHSLRRGGAAAAFHGSPNVPYFVWWGRWHWLATALEYALGYSDPAVVGALELPWPVGAQAADGGLGGPMGRCHVCQIREVHHQCYVGGICTCPCGAYCISC